MKKKILSHRNYPPSDSKLLSSPHLVGHEDLAVPYSESPLQGSLQLLGFTPCSLTTPTSVLSCTGCCGYVPVGSHYHLQPHYGIGTWPNLGPGGGTPQVTCMPL